MTKRALVVGIDNYRIFDPSGASNLNACVADARAMTSLLKNSFGFKEVYHYEDFRASRENILKAVAFLISVSEAGDSICFYFSGHGGRVRADLSKADCDTYMETLIPASGPPISDKDLAQLTQKLYPEAVNFTIITDACHSGGLHVGDDTIKCKGPAFHESLIRSMVDYMSTIIPFGLGLPAESDDLKYNVSNVVARASGVDLDPDPNRILLPSSKTTLLSACRFDELSWILPNYDKSIFTQSFLEVINQSGQEFDYYAILEQLQQKVKAKMTAGNPNHQQTPQLFGQRNRMTQPIFKGYTFTPADV